LSQSAPLPVAARLLDNAHNSKVEPLLSPLPAVAGAAAAEGDAVMRTNSIGPKGDSAAAIHASLCQPRDPGAAGPDASNSSHASEARSAGIAPPAAPDVDLDMPQGFAAARSDDDSDSMDDSLQPGSESPADAAPVEHDGADSTDGELPPGVDMELDEEIAEVKVERPEPVVIDLTADDEDEAEEQQQQGEEPSAKRARIDSQAADADGDAAAAAPSTSAVKAESGSGVVKEESRGASACATATAAAPAFHRTHSEFWRRLCLTPSQLQAVKSELPDGADPTKFDLLRNFDAAVLGECGLKRVQIATWADLLSRTPKDW